MLIAVVLTNDWSDNTYLFKEKNVFLYQRQGSYHFSSCSKALIAKNFVLLFIICMLDRCAGNKKETKSINFFMLTVLEK